MWEGPARSAQGHSRPAVRGLLPALRPLGTEQKHLSADLPEASGSPAPALREGVPCSGNDRAARMSFHGPGAWSVWENLVGSFRLPLMTLLTLALFPVVRELGATRGACCQLVLVQPPAAKGPDARRALPPRWERWLPLRSPGVNSILCLGRPPLPQPRLPPSQPFPAEPAGASCGGAEGGWGCRAGGNLFRFPSSQPLPQRARRFGPVSRAVCCP